MIRPLLSLGLAALCAAPSPAASFRIDSAGAKPRKYRITALCQGLDSRISPEVYRAGLFGGRGKWLKATPHPDFSLGLRGGELVLLEEAPWGSGEYRVVGDATDLDDIRLDPGVVVEGRTEWDMASKAWRVGSNTADLPGLPRYEGEPLGFAWFRDRALAMAAGVEPMHRGNFLVTSSALVTQWSNLIDANDDGHAVDHYVAKTRADYLDPFAAALAAADAPGRRRLLALHQEVTEAAAEMRAEYAADSWRPPVYTAAFDAILPLLGGPLRAVD